MNGTKNYCEYNAYVGFVDFDEKREVEFSYCFCKNDIMLDFGDIFFPIRKKKEYRGEDVVIYQVLRAFDRLRGKQKQHTKLRIHCINFETPISNTQRPSSSNTLTHTYNEWLLLEMLDRRAEICLCGQTDREKFKWLLR